MVLWCRHRWLPPFAGSRGAGQQWRCADHVDDAWWRREQGQEEAHDGALDFLAATTQQFAGTVVLEAFQCQGAGAVDELVGRLDKLFLQLLDLGFLF